MVNRAARNCLFALSGALLCACGKSTPATLSLQGDSVQHVVGMTFDAGGGKMVQTTECAFTVNATVSGTKGAPLTITQGRITYMYPSTGDTIMKRPIAAAELKDFFDGKTVVDVGDTVKSKRQGLSLSQPIQPIRGNVTFDYTAKGSTESKTSEPYTFSCK